METYTNQDVQNTTQARILFKLEPAEFIKKLNEACQQPNSIRKPGAVQMYIQRVLTFDEEDIDMCINAYLLHRVHSERKLLELKKRGYSNNDIVLAEQFERTYNAMTFLNYSHKIRMMTKEGKLYAPFRLPSYLLLGEECKEDLQEYFQKVYSFAGIYLKMDKNGCVPSDFEGCEDIQCRPVLFEENKLVETLTVLSEYDVNKKRKIE